MLKISLHRGVLCPENSPFSSCDSYMIFLKRRRACFGSKSLAKKLSLKFCISVQASCQSDSLIL